jgi:anti-anti-sigma factor
VLAVDGEVDLSNLDEFCERCAHTVQTSENAIIDLTACSYIGSAGLNALFRLMRHDPSPRAIVVPKSSLVRRLFEIVRAGDVMPIFDGIEAALTAVQETAAQRRAQRLRSVARDTKNAIRRTKRTILKSEESIASAMDEAKDKIIAKEDAIIRNLSSQKLSEDT